MFGFQSREGFLEAEAAWSGKIKWCRDTAEVSCDAEAVGRQWKPPFEGAAVCWWETGGEGPWAPKGISQNLKENSRVGKRRQRDVCVFTVSCGSVYLLWTLKWRVAAFETVCEVCALPDSTSWDPGEINCPSDVGYAWLWERVSRSHGDSAAVTGSKQGSLFLEEGRDCLETQSRCKNFSVFWHGSRLRLCECPARGIISAVISQSFNSYLT